MLLCHGRGNRLTQSALLFWKKKSGDGKLKEEGKNLYFTGEPSRRPSEARAVMLPEVVPKISPGRQALGWPEASQTSPAVKLKKRMALRPNSAPPRCPGQARGPSSSGTWPPGSTSPQPPRAEGLPKEGTLQLRPKA